MNNYKVYYVMILVFTYVLHFCTSMNNEANVQYIIPISGVSQYPTNDSYMTIAQYFDSLKFVDQSNSSVPIALYFLPGEHILETRNYSMTNTSNVQLVGLPSSERNVDIICNGDGKILFNEMHTLRLEALHFISQKGKSCAVEVFSSRVCEIIDINSLNTSIYLHSVTSLRAQNIVISKAVSGRSMMIIEKCTGVLTNFTVENNTATAILGKIVTIVYSTLHIKGFMCAINNTSTLQYNQRFLPRLIFMRNTSVQVSAHLVFTRNTNFLALWAIFNSYIKFQCGELTIYYNYDMGYAALVLTRSTFCFEKQANINISDNISWKYIIEITLASSMDTNGITKFYNNYAQEDSLRVIMGSSIILAENASFANNVNSGIFNIGGCVLYIGHRSFLYTNATVTFANNTGYSGGGIAVLESSVLGSSTLSFRGITKFINNSANEGGAIYILQSHISLTSSIHFQGLTIFANNSAARGGAIYCGAEKINISFTGDTIFTSNRAKQYGAHFTLSYHDIYIYFSGNTTVEKGISLLGGVITTIGNTLIVFNGVNIFAQNSAKTQTGIITTSEGVNFHCHGNNTFIGNEGGVLMFHNNATFMINGITFFSNNFSPALHGIGAIYVLNSSGTLQGYTKFSNNTASKSLYGLVGILSSRVTLKGNIQFLENSASGAAALSVFFNSNVNFMGNITLALNRAQRDGGAMACARSSMVFQGHSKFEMNEVQSVQGYGGAIHAANCRISLKGVHIFNSNKASHGGALSLISDSRIFLTSVKLVFINNSADFGGAVYIQDTMSPTDCMDDIKLLTSSSFLFRSECFFDTDTIRSSEIKVIGNYATNQGNFLLGGKLNRCTVKEKSGDKTFLKLFDNSLISADTNALITSQPYRLCFCSSRDNGPNCNIELLHVQAIHGELFVVSVVALDQLNHAVFSTVRAELPESSNKTSRLGAFDGIQTTNAVCTELRYRIFSVSETEDIFIYAEGPCGKMGSASRIISITFLPCPDGFQVYGDHCLCSSQLQRHASNTTHCDVDGQLFIKSGDFWMGALYRNDSYIGLLLYSHCPFDYCIQSTVNFTLNNSDAQCNFNRSGILCGECKFNYSLVLGGSMCSACSNDYIALTLVIILAGVMLVVVLILLKLTVASGMVNGLIFYANVVALNIDIFFPPGKPNWLKIFISWVNLDLGIQVCFYDGMDTYVHTWLQFLFPFYLWMLVGAIIFISHRSTTITKWLGSNPVAVLATIFLLSYMKLLRTIAAIFYYAKLEHPDGAKKVWLYDGNIDYLQGKHIPLFIFALVIFLIFFLPFNFLLLCSPYLRRVLGRMYQSQIKSSLYKIFVGWYDDYRIQAFMDAYNAPYNLEYRYWTGLFLLIRCALFLVFAVNALGNPSTNMLAIAIATLGLLVLMRLFVKGRVYKNWFIDAFESFFLLNLGILSLAINHNNLIGGNQETLVNIAVGLSFAMFVAIILHHVYKQLRKSDLLRAIFSKFHLSNFIMISKEVNADRSQLHDRLLQSSIELKPSTVAPTTSVISISSQGCTTD